MHAQVYRKWLLYLSLLGVALSILVGFYDVIFGYLFEFIHLFLDVIELSLDKLIEHIFHTELRETQIIVFYIMLVVGGILIYVTWKLLVYLCKDFIENLKNECLELKTAVSLDWQALPVMERVIYISLFIIANYLLSFLLF